MQNHIGRSSRPQDHRSLIVLSLGWRIVQPLASEHRPYLVDELGAARPAGALAARPADHLSAHAQLLDQLFRRLQGQEVGRPVERELDQPPRELLAPGLELAGAQIIADLAKRAGQIFSDRLEGIG